MPQTCNAPVSPSVKTRRVKHIKQPVVIVTKPAIKQLPLKRKKSNATGVTTSNNDSSQINISRAEFDSFKLSDSDLEVPSKSSIGGVPQSPISSGLQRPNEMNNLENSEVLIMDKLSPGVSITGGLSLDQKKEEALITGELSPDVPITGGLSLDQEKEEPVGQSLKVPITIKLSPLFFKVVVIFDQKHQFDSISGTHDTSLYIDFWIWLRQDYDSFDIVYVDDILQQPLGSLNCVLYISAYTEFLSDDNGIPTGPFDLDLMRSIYTTLL
uniref:Ubiquitin-like protease family profile domain-containing protein n=1 Tax=Solanum lycopersicum TaxID=4081 RepID=A0A3Q7HMZ9_SOLLC